MWLITGRGFLPSFHANIKKTERIFINFPLLLWQSSWLQIFLPLRVFFFFIISLDGMIKQFEFLASNNKQMIRLDSGAPSLSMSPLKSQFTTSIPSQHQQQKTLFHSAYHKYLMSLICGCVQKRTRKNWGAAPLCIFCQNEIVVKIYRRIPFSWFTGHPKAILLNGVNVKDIHVHAFFFLLFSSWTLVLARWASPAAAAASRFMPSGKVSLLLEELNLISHPGVWICTSRNPSQDDVYAPSSAMPFIWLDI